MQPLKTMHYDSNLEYGGFSDKKYSVYLSLVAILILMIACVNFINLSNSAVVRRSKEVGVRKVAGATKHQLISQYMSEAMILCILGLCASLIFITIFLPYFNELAGKDLRFDLMGNDGLLIAMILITLGTGFISGIYPSFIMSSFKPAVVIKGHSIKNSITAVFFKRTLIIFQFSLALIFITGTMIVNGQLNFIKDKDLGFIKDNILSISLSEDIRLAERYDVIKSEIIDHSEIIEMTASGTIPGSYEGYLSNYKPEGSDPVHLAEFYVNSNYFDFYDMEIIKGKSFSDPSLGGQKDLIILSEKAVKEIGWENPIGKIIPIDMDIFRAGNKGGTVFHDSVKIELTVVGIVADIHTGSLKEDIKPLMFRLRPEMCNYFSFKISDKNLSGTIKFIQDKWSEIAPNMFFEYEFNDARIERAYNLENQTNRIFMIASVIAILLSSLGLYGMLCLSIQRRIKEIGIRKVMGVSLHKLFFLLTKEIGVNFSVAFIISCPIVYFLMINWLDNFAYRTDLSVIYFILPVFLAGIISIITISKQVYKAATSNPVEALRYE